MHSILVKLFKYGFLIIICQKECQCINTKVCVNVGQNFAIETGPLIATPWYGILNGQKILLALCSSDNCLNLKKGFSASSQSDTYKWYKSVLKVINVSSDLTRIQTWGDTWDIVFIENGIPTLSPIQPAPEFEPTDCLQICQHVYNTTTISTFTSGPCFFCDNELHTTKKPSKPNTSSSKKWVVGLCAGLTVPICIIVYIPLHSRMCRYRYKAAAGDTRRVQPPLVVIPRVHLVHTNDNPSPIYDQILDHDVNLQMTQGPTPPPLYREQPPSYKSLPPSYESVMKCYQHNKNTAK